MAVKIIDDNVYEPDEYFEIVLSAAAPAHVWFRPLTRCLMSWWHPSIVRSEVPAG